jgi:hypothetical protein
LCLRTPQLIVFCCAPRLHSLGYTANWESVKVMFCCLLKQFNDQGTLGTVVTLATPYGR